MNSQVKKFFNTFWHRRVHLRILSGMTGGRGGKSKWVNSGRTRYGSKTDNMAMTQKKAVISHNPRGVYYRQNELCLEWTFSIW